MNKRKDELIKLLKDETMLPLIDEIIYLENQLDILRNLPKIKIDPNNPEKQKATPAAKLYKEYLQQYLNAIKLLSKETEDKSNEQESPLRKWVKSKNISS